MPLSLTSSEPAWGLRRKHVHLDDEKRDQVFGLELRPLRGLKDKIRKSAFVCLGCLGIGVVLERTLLPAMASRSPCAPECDEGTRHAWREEGKGLLGGDSGGGTKCGTLEGPAAASSRCRQWFVPERYFNSSLRRFFV